MADNNAGNAWPRWINILAGAWLFISAFVWPHTASAQTNTWIVGALIFIFAIVAMFQPTVRWVNTVLAVWLFISNWIFPHANAGTTWNNVIVAIVVFVISLTPSSTVQGTHHHAMGTT